MRNLFTVFAVIAIFICHTAANAAYVFRGSVVNNTIFQPIHFYRNGNIDINITVSTNQPVDYDAVLQVNHLYVYNYFDPITGDYTGGNDNYGDYQDALYLASFVQFSGTYSSSATYIDAMKFRYTELRNPGDPYAYKEEYNEDKFQLAGFIAPDGLHENYPELQASYTIVVSGSAVVPEPATWSLLMLGFTLVGSGLRRRVAVRL